MTKLFYVGRFFFFLLLWSVFFVPLALLGLFSSQNARSLYAWLCIRSLRLMKIDSSVEYEEDLKKIEGPFVFLGLNQESPLDGFLWPAYLPVTSRFVVNLEYCFVPFVGWACFFTRDFIIVRQWKRLAKKILEKAVPYLRCSQKNALSIQMDGYVRSEKIIGPYKKGGLALALKSEAKIIPVVVLGARECLRRGAFFTQEHPVKIKFLKAIETQGKKFEDRYDLLEQLKDIARKELPDRTVL